MSSISGAPTFKVALHDVAQTLFGDNVWVTYGLPAFDSFDDIVSFAETSSESSPATLGTRRQREEQLTQNVIFYCYRAGGQEQELVVMQRAYELLALLETQVRVTDTTVGGTVRECFLTAHASDAATDTSILANGRLHVLTATFTAKNRITS